jgi:hypothetical protein
MIAALKNNNLTFLNLVNQSVFMSQTLTTEEAFILVMINGLGKIFSRI